MWPLVAAPTTQTPQPAFRFQNSFWVNLHHTLRGESRRREFRAPAMIKTNGLKPDERVVVAGILDAVPGQKVDPQLQTPKSAAAEPAGPN